MNIFKHMLTFSEKLLEHVGINLKLTLEAHEIFAMLNFATDVN